MLKGHSTIELTDIKTGKVERYEDDNLVTNGLQYYSRYNSIPSNVWSELFSGLRLYDTALKEDVDTLYAPLGTEQIGYAGLSADTTDPKRGLFNASESGVLDDLSGVKLVWDFAQNQANGTIACIGITPNKYIEINSNYGSGHTPKREYQNYNEDIVEDAANEQILEYDFTKGLATTFSSNKANGRIRISKVYKRIYFRSIMDSEHFYKVLSDNYIDIPELTSKYLTEVIFVGGDADYFYFVTLKNYITNTKPYVSTFLLIKLSKDTSEVKTEEFQFSDGAYPENYFYSSSSNCQLCSSFLMNGHLYLSNRYDYKFYKFKLSDLSFVKILSSPEIEMTISGRSSVMVRKDGALLNGISIGLNDEFYTDRWLYWRNSSDNAANLFKEKRILPIHNGLLGLIVNGRYLGCYIAAMLFTVNNISGPVVKTADKTMKITYILKEDYGDTPTPPTS